MSGEKKRSRRSGKRRARKAKLAAKQSAAISREGDDGPAGGEGTSEGRGAGAGKGKGKGKGKAAGAPRQGDSEAARRIDALEAGDYGGAGPEEEEEEEDFAERFTRCLLEDASGGY